MRPPPEKNLVFDVNPRPEPPVDERPKVVGEEAVPGGKTAESLAEALTALLGEDKVSVADAVREENSRDKWYASAIPEVVVFAEGAEDFSKLLAFAHDRFVPVTTRGAGIGYVGGCVPVAGGIVLSLVRMARILEINPKDGVAVVQPGVITGDLQDSVRALGFPHLALRRPHRPGLLPDAQAVLSVIRARLTCRGFRKRLPRK